MQKSLNIPLLSFIILFATLAIAGIGGMMVVTLRQKIARSAARIQTIEQESTRLGRLSEELRTKIASLEHPDVLKRIAANLGMQPASLDQYRLVISTQEGPKPTYQTAKSNYVSGY